MKQFIAKLTQQTEAEWTVRGTPADWEWSRRVIVMPPQLVGKASEHTLVLHGVDHTTKTKIRDWLGTQEENHVIIVLSEQFTRMHKLLQAKSIGHAAVKIPDFHKKLDSVTLDYLTESAHWKKTGEWTITSGMFYNFKSVTENFKY